MPFSVSTGALPCRALPAAISAVIVLALIPGTLALTPIARADTPAQMRQAIQAVCDRAAASYGRRDLAGFMAMYSPDLLVRNVEGNPATFRQLQSGLKILLARNGPNATGRCTVSQVTPQGLGARAVLHWHYLIHRPRSKSAPAYTIMRSYEATAVWKKLPGGWKEASADVTHNVIEYKR